MRITRIEIRNFRSIRHLALDLGNTTVFIGPNNVGKTVILDAVRLVLTRRWGENWLRFKGTDVGDAPNSGGEDDASGACITLWIEESASEEWPRSRGVEGIILPRPRFWEDYLTALEIPVGLEAAAEDVLEGLYSGLKTGDSKTKDIMRAIVYGNRDGDLEAQLVADGLGEELRKILQKLGVRGASGLTDEALVEALRNEKTGYAVELADRIRGNRRIAQRGPNAFRQAIAMLPELKDTNKSGSDWRGTQPALSKANAPRERVGAPPSDDPA